MLPLLLLGGALLCACDGILDSIYDEADEQTATADSSSLSADGYGFTAYDTDTGRGTAYINATDYYVWTYLDFHSLCTDTLTIDLSLDDPLGDEPTDWDLALHRWDVRTNGGAGLETEFSSLDDLIASGQLPEGDFVADVWYDSVSVDMSDMMSGNIGYLSCYVNRELGKWMDVSIASMPPTYTPSGKVYLARFGDGSLCAHILSAYMNASGTKGYLTIDFIYPLTF